MYKHWKKVKFMVYNYTLVNCYNNITLLCMYLHFLCFTSVLSSSTVMIFTPLEKAPLNFEPLISFSNAGAVSINREP